MGTRQWHETRDMEKDGMRTGYHDAMGMLKRMDSDGIHPDFDRGYEKGYAKARNMMTMGK